MSQQCKRKPHQFVIIKGGAGISGGFVPTCSCGWQSESDYLWYWSANAYRMWGSKHMGMSTDELYVNVNAWLKKHGAIGFHSASVQT